MSAGKEDMIGWLSQEMLEVMAAAKFARLRERGSVQYRPCCSAEDQETDRTRVLSKGMASTFCSAHSNRAKTYRTP